MNEHNICILSTTIPPEFAGAGKRAFNQACYIAKSGKKIYFLTTTSNNHQIPNLEIITVSLPFLYKSNNIIGKIFRHIYHPILFLKLFVIIRIKNFQVVHCIPGSSWFALLSILASKLKGAKVIAETTLDGTDDPVSISNSKLGFLKKRIFDKADSIVNISPLLSEKCKKAGVPKDKIYIIPNGVDTDKFKPPKAEEKNKLRKKFSLEKYNWVFIYVGILRPRKGVKEIIEAFSSVKEEFVNSCLVLAGPTSKDKENITYYNSLKEIAERERLGGQVIFTGEINNVEEWMKASDIFLFASQREGFGTVLVEAMSAGLPVIAKRIPKITDYIIKNGENGIIVDSQDGFIKSIKILIKDEDYYNNLSNNARDTVLKGFSDKVVMDEYFKLYDKLLF